MIGEMTPEIIAEVTRRLVDYYHPEHISTAQGDNGPDSDIDFCVVLPEDAPKPSKSSESRQAISIAAPLTWFRPCPP